MYVMARRSAETELKRISNLKDMEVNPSAYFNFGFTKNDYLVFMIKHMVMRSERQVIEQEFAKELEAKGFKLWLYINKKWMRWAK